MLSHYFLQGSHHICPHILLRPTSINLWNQHQSLDVFTSFDLDEFFYVFLQDWPGLVLEGGAPKEKHLTQITRQRFPVGNVLLVTELPISNDMGIAAFQIFWMNTFRKLIIFLILILSVNITVVGWTNFHSI